MVANSANETKVLCLYSGGTLGMLATAQGYVPEKGYLTQYLKSQARFHDPLGDSLFSNSQTAATYRSWSSAQNSPDGSRPTSPLPHNGKHSLMGQAALAKTRAHIGQLESHDLSAHTLITPPIGPNGNRIRYSILEYEPLLDSPDMTSADWIRLAADIEANYSAYDGFVILHGTDTMAYTSSALSFLLEDLGKTVIVTGAQVPLGQLRNDAVENTLNSIILAGTYVIPEVCLYFDRKLLRGNRTRKVSSSDFAAFASPNMDPLAELGVHVEIDWFLVHRPTALQAFRAHKQLDNNVAVLQIFPGISTATVKAFLSPPLRGIVLESFGAGNIPQREDVFQVIKEACDRGVVIVNITQCTKGSVLAYFLSTDPAMRKLAAAGVVSGADMTPEAALSKLSYLLSKEELDTTTVRQLMSIPIRGEMTLPNDSPTAVSGQSSGLEGIMGHLLHLNASPDAIVNTSRRDDAPQTTSRVTGALPRKIDEHDSRLAESLLLPYTLCLAAAKNDLSTMMDLIKRAHTFTENSSGHNRSEKAGRNLIDDLDPAFGKNALHVAADCGSKACLEALLQIGTFVHTRDRAGHTA
ncbi:hypothetical protein QFC22_005410 [Naganishia vaughanmartiniae]|uniref:Uncharacterized protein n=1 Tax=Naganishia vaughanmartiniae TaxID=1424756 RepID=A0ACC2WX16_9TREE|nr:hypothetical protein QFC22_005410 [Naganishia vaughanmartiniae]